MPPPLIQPYPFAGLPRVSAEDLQWQPARQRLRAVLGWLGAHLCAALQQAQPARGWRQRALDVRGPAPPGEALTFAAADCAHTQLLTLDDAGHLTSPPTLLAISDGLARALTADLTAPIEPTTEPDPGARPPSPQLSGLARAQLDALLLDALAAAAAELPAGCGWQLLQSGVPLDAQQHALRSREPTFAARLTLLHTPPGASPRADGLWLVAPARLDATRTARAAWALSARDAPWWPLLRQHPYTLRVICGWGAIPAGQLTQARPGALLLPAAPAARVLRPALRPVQGPDAQATPASPPNLTDSAWHFGPCWLGDATGWRPVLASFSAEGVALTVLPPTDHPPQGAPPMSPHQPSAAHPPMTASERAAAAESSAGHDPIFDRLPLHVVFELGRVTLTAAEVAHLRAGDVITLRRDLRAPVQVWIGDLLAGEGELVDADGQLGVRLLWIDPRDPAAPPTSSGAP